MSNKEFELEQEIILIGGKEALEFAKKYGINYELLKEYLLAGYTIEQLKILLEFTNRLSKVIKLLWDKTKNNLEGFSKLALSYKNKKPFKNKYLKRCANRQKLYEKRKKLGRVK